MQIARKYRDYKGTSEFKFNVTYRESDLLIISDKNIKNEAIKSLIKYRRFIEGHIKKYPEFYSSLKPLKIPEKSLPDIIKDMYKAGKAANVGPFASVAGAISEFVAKDLKFFCNEIIIENGGDNFIDTKGDRIIRIFSDNLNSLGIKIFKNIQPVAVCSSSAKIGHSLSLGNAELVTVIAKNGAIADAFATSICNKIKDERDLQIVLNNVKMDKLIGVLAIIDGKIGIKGKIDLVKIKR